MKNSVLLSALISLFALSQTFCQYENPEYQEKQEKKPVIYVGLSTGINNFNGMVGGFLELHPANKITLAGGLGLGFWGYKATGGLRYYKNYPKGIYYCGSFSVHSGLKDFEFVQDDNYGNTQTIFIDLNPVYTANLTIGYQLGLWENLVRINFEGGYAIALTTDYYEVKSGGQLTETSKQAFDLMTPGGIVLGIGASFGF
jgi:hypothetical protein